MNSQQLEKLKLLAQKANNEQWPGQSGFGSRFAKAILADNSDIISMFGGASFGQGANSRAEISIGLRKVQEAVDSDTFKVPYPLTLVQANRFNITFDSSDVRPDKRGVEIIVPNISIRKARKINEQNSN